MPTQPWEDMSANWLQPEKWGDSLQIVAKEVKDGELKVSVTEGKGIYFFGPFSASIQRKNGELVVLLHGPMKTPEIPNYQILKKFPDRCPACNCVFLPSSHSSDKCEPEWDMRHLLCECGLCHYKWRVRTGAGENVKPIWEGEKKSPVVSVVIWTVCGVTFLHTLVSALGELGWLPW